MASEPTVELLAALEKTVVLLQRSGEERWAKWLEKDLKLIEAQDFYGIEHLLQAFGGMGSLSDLVLADTSSNEELHSLRSQLYELGSALRRARARE